MTAAPRASETPASPSRPLRAETGGTAPRAGEIGLAASVLTAESAAIDCVRARLETTAGAAAFSRAVDLIVACAESGGAVLVTGLGKSGLVGAKLSATLTSLGIPSHPVHPTEAAHGDLGRFRPADTVIAISHSGETSEVIDLILTLRQDGLPIIAITRGGPGADAPASSLERLATVALTLGVASEAGAPEIEAPTSSTTATMALGDALALTAARRRNFTSADFARRHPGGALGGLMRPVSELLRFVAGKNLPLIEQSCSVAVALERAARAGRRPGAILLVHGGDGPDAARLAGIFTDGDLRRLVLRDRRELDRPIGEVMTHAPRTLPATALVRDAVHLVSECRADEIPVVDDQGRPVGVLDVQDLIAMRLVRD